jgi:hypothetical protein
MRSKQTGIRPWNTFQFSPGNFRCRRKKPQISAISNEARRRADAGSSIAIRGRLRLAYRQLDGVRRAATRTRAPAEGLAAGQNTDFVEKPVIDGDIETRRRGEGVGSGLVLELEFGGGERRHLTSSDDLPKHFARLPPLLRHGPAHDYKIRRMPHTRAGIGARIMRKS